ncbi:hypothetical protein DLB09_16365 [Salmonella enterica subsp. salamae]|nr:hypothetical protein [Salmonella enterica subsp. salamae]
MTITKERLLKIQHWRETYGAGSNVMLPAEEAEELARIALASLEVAPVGEVSEKRRGLVMDGTVDLGGKSTYRIIKGEKAMKRLPLGTKFYIAPPAPVVPEECPAELPYAQVKAVADLFALCWQSGEVVTYTPDPEKATIWLNNYSGTCVQEYVKLERLQEALSGNSPVIPGVYLADINTDHQH